MKLSCQLCPIGTFKTIPGFQECNPCINKPKSSFYVSSSNTSTCRFECEEHLRFEGFKNTKCFGLDRIYLENTNSAYGPIILVIIMIFFGSGYLFKRALTEHRLVQEKNLFEMEEEVEDPAYIEK